jgi:3-methylcrotonyl-CoA carboxylase alpha subunit
MGRAAVEAAKAVGYVGAGTVEFIASGAGGLKPNGFWFMEMNTRLQVEHPVTEAITGIDLVEWQFRIANGEPLPLTQDKVPLNGHAVEARLYAEDPERGFIPSTGRLIALDLPRGDGIRVDTGVEAGAEVSPFYDPMIAKVIAHAPSRGAALDRLAEALDRTVAAGPRTNVAFLAALARAPGFRADDFDTGFIDRNLDTLGAVPQPLDAAAVAAGAERLVAQQEERLAARVPLINGQAHSPWGLADGFQLSGKRSTDLPVAADGLTVSAGVAIDVNGREITVEGVGPAPDARTIDAAGAVYVLRYGRQTVVRLAEADLDPAHTSGDGVVRAPMHGKLLALLVEKGARVEKGHRVAVIEAMKMEHTLTAPIDGTVTEITATMGSQLAENATIMVIEAAADGPDTKPA